MIVVFYLFMIIGVVTCDIYLQVTRRSDFGWCHLTRIPEVRLSCRKHPRPTGSEESVSRRLFYRMLVRLLEGCLLTDVCIPLLFHWSYRVTPGAACRLPPSPEGGFVLRATSSVPVLSKKELGGESWDYVHVWVLFCVGNYVMFLVIDLFLAVGINVVLVWGPTPGCVTWSRG